MVKALGGISPIDPLFIQNMTGKGVLAEIDAVAVHGFPLDWNHWQLNDWPEKLKEIQAVTSLPVWPWRLASRPSAPRRCRCSA